MVENVSRQLQSNFWSLHYTEIEFSSSIVSKIRFVVLSQPNSDVNSCIIENHGYIDEKASFLKSCWGIIVQL